MHHPGTAAFLDIATAELLPTAVMGGRRSGRLGIQPDLVGAKSLLPPPGQIGRNQNFINDSAGAGDET
jgi:hypothetical protein